MRLLKQSMTWNKEELLEQQVFTMNWLAVSAIMEGGEMLCYRFVSSICNTYCTFICQIMHHASLFFKSYTIFQSIFISFLNSQYLFHERLFCPYRNLAREILIINNFSVKRKSIWSFNFYPNLLTLKSLSFKLFFCNVNTILNSPCVLLNPFSCNLHVCLVGFLTVQAKMDSPLVSSSLFIFFAPSFKQLAGQRYVLVTWHQC